MSWKKKLDSSSPAISNTYPLASAKIPLAQTSQIKTESERQGPAGPVHLPVWEDSCDPQLLR